MGSRGSGAAAVTGIHERRGSARREIVNSADSSGRCPPVTSWVAACAWLPYSMITSIRSSDSSRPAVVVRDKRPSDGGRINNHSLGRAGRLETSLACQPLTTFIMNL